jgi:hypothetical protein
LFYPLISAETVSSNRSQGDSSNMRKLFNWLKLWHENNSGSGKNPNPKPPPWKTGADNGFWAKAALLSGQPGEKNQVFVSGRPDEFVKKRPN